jgi:hypothetical protein
MVEEEESLYEDKDIKITFFCRDPESHKVHILKSGSRYIFPRGVLREFATTSRDDLEKKINGMGSLILHDARKYGLSVDSIGMAIAQAYIEQEERFRREDL